ncbi:MAG: hypothetical protein ACI8QC_003966 [Planctomycetota bacterium]|jgi:hypothetical protein
MLPHASPLRILWVLLCASCLALGGTAQAQDPPKKKPPGVFLTVQEALDLAFPKAELVRETVYLSKQELKRFSKLAGESVEQRILHPYRAYAPPAKPGGKRGALLATAWFDTHKVRTVRETLMVVVNADGKVARLEILAFAEPKKYLPRAKWYAQFLGKSLGPELDTKRDIRGIAGASMSCRAATHAVRRMLAGHQIAQEQAQRAREKAAQNKTKNKTKKKTDKDTDK